MAVRSIVRQATIKDLDLFVRLEKAGFTSDQFARDQLRYLLDEANATGFIVEQAGQSCGAAIMAWRKNSAVGRLYSIVIDPVFQGQGLGRTLLQACEASAVEHGCDRLSLEVRADNRRAITLYQHHGYETTQLLPGYYADGTNGLRMVKPLARRGQTGIHLDVPYYAQTLEFTSGPASLMMAMRYHVPGLMLNRALELMLWKEATQTLIASGLGGCGPFGLAVAAQRRGYQISVVSADHQIPFLSSVRGKDKKELIRLLDEQLREEARSLGVVQQHDNFTFEEIVQAIRGHSVPIVVINTYRPHCVKRPHWAVVTGFDSRYVYFHDPYSGFSTPQAQHRRMPISEFRRMRRHSTAVNESVIFVSRERRVPEARFGSAPAVLAMTAPTGD
jgi:ribosomal protein S18 acetylase RimI-like enzyme